MEEVITYINSGNVIFKATDYSINDLRDFIYERNKGRNIFFLPDEKAAIEKLSQV